MDSNTTKEPIKYINGDVEVEKKNDHFLAEEYVKSLSEVEKATMKIAEEHLKTSYSLKKSIGYMKWLGIRNNK